MCRVLVVQSCPTLCDPMDWAPPGSSVHGILQARILECVAISFSGDLPDSGIEPSSPALQVILCHLSHQGCPQFLMEGLFYWFWSPARPPSNRNGALFQLNSGELGKRGDFCFPPCVCVAHRSLPFRCINKTRRCVESFTITQTPSMRLCFFSNFCVEFVFAAVMFHLFGVFFPV